MMPFRYILKRGGVDHPIGYSLLLLAAGMFVSMMVAVIISVSASNRAIKQSQGQQAQQQKAARHAACLVIVTQDNVYHDPSAPPASEAGRNAADAWRNLRNVFQCDQE